MDETDVWVANDEGTEIVRARDIAAAPAILRGLGSRTRVISRRIRLAPRLPG
jgi:hypothetical protein